MGVAIVITSGKGGTGKTSVTGGLASILAAVGYRTLCLDADVGLNNLDITLGMADRAAFSFYDVMLGNADLRRSAVEHPLIKDLFLLTAPVSVGAETISLTKMGELIDRIKASYDFCVIDCPAGLGRGFELAARFADRAIVVANPDAACLRDARRTAERLDDLGISPVQLVVNRVKRKILRRMSSNIDDMMDTTALPLIGVIPEDEMVMLSANQGTPLILYEKNGAAVALLNIARRIEGKRIPLMKIK